MDFLRVPSEEFAFPPAYTKKVAFCRLSVCLWSFHCQSAVHPVFVHWLSDVRSFVSHLFLPLNIPCPSAIHHCMLSLCCLSIVSHLAFGCLSAVQLLSIPSLTVFCLLSIFGQSVVGLMSLPCCSLPVYCQSAEILSAVPLFTPLYIGCPSTCLYSFHMTNHCQNSICPIPVSAVCLMRFCLAAA